MENLHHLMEDLERALEDEGEILEGFLLLLHREKEDAGTRQAERLLERCRLKEPLLGKIRAAQTQRTAILGRLGRRLGWSDDGPWTLSRALLTPGIPAGSRLAELRERLLLSISEIRKSHLKDSRLMSHSLARIRDRLRTLEMLTDSCPVYGSTGRVNRGANSECRIVNSEF